MSVRAGPESRNERAENKQMSKMSVSKLINKGDSNFGTWTLTLMFRFRQTHSGAQIQTETKGC